MESFASKRIPKCIQLLPKKTKDIKTHKGLKNNQFWSILRRKIRSLKRRRRLGLWGDNIIKVLPSNSRDLLHCSSFIFFTVLFLFSLNISSFNFLCYLINKSVCVFNVLDVYVLVFFYLDLFFIKLHLDRTCDNLIFDVFDLFMLLSCFFIFLIIYLICFASRLCFILF